MFLSPLWVSLSQGYYDPAKTQVLHLKMNPTAEAKQQQQQEAQAVQEELTALRERVRPRQDGGSQEDSSMHNLGLTLPPSKVVLGKINMYSNLH